MTTPTTSVVLLASAGWDATFRALVAIAQHAGPDRLETIVVDDGTRDDTALALSRLEGVRVLRNESPHGAAAAFNQGAAVAQGEYVAFLHGDSEPRAGWLAPLVALAASDADVAVVGSRTLRPDGRIEQDGIALAYAAPYPITPWLAGAGEPATAGDDVAEVPAVSGAAMLVRADVLRALDGFDEGYWNGGEDVDLCLRAAELGGRVLLCRASTAIHHGECGAVAGDADRAAALLAQRWLGKVALFTPAERPAPEPISPARAPMTVVVPVENDLGTLAGCAEGILRNLRPEDELILADGGSTDGTRRFADLLAQDHGGKVRVVPSDPAAGREGAVRAGLLEASRPVVALLHAHVSPPDGFLDEMTRLLAEHREYGVLALPAEPVLCAIGPAAALRAVGDVHPEALCTDDPRPLDAALGEAGARLLVLGAAA